MKTYKRKCKECGIEFETKDHRIKYCCPEHSKKSQMTLSRTMSAKVRLEAKARAKGAIPEDFTLEYTSRNFFLREVLSVEDVSVLSAMFRSRLKEFLPLKDREVLRSDGRTRKIPSLYCNTDDVYRLIQDCHSKYKENVYTQDKWSRDTAVRLLKQIERKLNDKLD